MIEAPAPKSPKVPPRRVAIVVAAAVIVAVLVWVLAGSGGSSKNSSSSASAKPVAATQTQLLQLAAKLKHPIYWAGVKQGYTYELTQTSDGNVYVRYLPPGVNVGDKRADFLTVGTYPETNPMRSLTNALKRKGTQRFAVPQSGTAVQDSAHPTSVYLTFPNSSLLLEVFEPSPAAARSVVRSGAITPVG
jgi:hypothetical protein